MFLFRLAAVMQEDIFYYHKPNDTGLHAYIHLQFGCCLTWQIYLILRLSIFGLSLNILILFPSLININKNAANLK